MKDERIRLKPCSDLDGGSDEMAEENFELQKRKDENTSKREITHHEQTPKEGINHLEEIRIRFIVCLNFINLN